MSWKQFCDSYILIFVCCRYQVLRVSNVTDELATEVLSQLYLSDTLFDFLTPPSMNQPTDILLCPEQVDNVKAVFEEFKIPYSVKISDLNE